MTEPLLGMQPLVYRLDHDEVQLVHSTPGPAGWNSFTVAGIEVNVDAANPSQLDRVVVGNVVSLRGKRFDALVALLGAEKAEWVMDRLSRGVRNDRFELDRSNPAQRPKAVSTHVARLAVALSTAERPGLLAYEAALLALDAFVSAAATPLLEWMPELRDEATAAADHLDQLAKEAVLQLPPASVPAATATLKAAAGLLAAGHQRALLRAAESIESHKAKPTALRGRLSSEPSEFAADSLPIAVGDTMPVFSLVEGDEYEVRITGWAGRAEGWWVRVFPAADGGPAAIAPMIDDDADAVATFLLDVASPDGLVIDIVDDPLQPRSTASAAAFRAAIGLGRRAARLERLGNLTAARTMWQRASALHTAGGDEARSRQATAIADDELAASYAARRIKVEPISSDFTGPIA